MLRAEEEPEEPETEPQPPAPSSSASPLAVAVAAAPGVEFEYRTETVTADQVIDGNTLPDLLAKESKDGWDLVDILQAQDQYIVLLRKPKKPERDQRRVGFFSR